MPIKLTLSLSSLPTFYQDLVAKLGALTDPRVTRTELQRLAGHLFPDAAD